MDPRGRSRDVSPIALALDRTDPSPTRAFNHRANYSHRQPHLCDYPLSSSPFHAGPSNPHRDPCHSAAPSSPPVAHLPPRPSPLHQHSSLSTSPADTIPRTQSSSSLFSDASEHTSPGPLTPPDVANGDDYALERSLDYYTSPPSPPRSLQDQMHVAYAMDNMHLAKVLLLKLQGIEVSGDDDPRIAAVRDEDFSSSFVPEGGLRLDPEVEARIQAAEQRARQVQLQRQREERLRRLERVWEKSVRRFKATKERIEREKLEAEHRRRGEQREAKERERARKAAEAARAARVPQLRIASGPPRQLLCYDSLRNADARFPKPTHVNCDAGGLFLYDIMPSSPSRPMSSSPPTSRSPTDKDDLSLPRVQRELALKHAKNVSRSVAFCDVLTAMHGALFVDEVGSRSHARCNPHQRDLLATLLEPSEDMEEKGKARQEPTSEPVPRGTKMKNMAVDRVARSSTLESTSSVSSTITSPSTATRSGSWFSFASRSSVRSNSTAVTTPSSSPLATSKSSIVLAAPLSTSPPSDTLARTRRRCAKPPIPSIVLAADHPLAPTPPLKSKSRQPLTKGRGRPLARRMSVSTDTLSSAPSGLVHRVSRSVSNVIDFAAQLQRAYVKATMFSAGVDLYGRSSSGSRSTSRSPVRSDLVRYTSTSSHSSGLRPTGYRACSLDVHVFTATDPLTEAESRKYQRNLIPLCSPSTDTLPAHQRVFPLPPPLPRSPFRRAFMPGERLSRLRPVANPILLRLQALHNTCAVHAIAWQRARDGSMASGKEKVVGIAWDGIGRSSLSWEVDTGSSRY